MIIKQAVRILDEMLDRDPQNKEAWLKLGEALSIGFADSKHAASANAAWHTAYEIDPTECHAGALMARSAARTETEQAIRELTLRHPRCAEATYLTALFLPSSAATRLRGLQESIALMKSADALVALGQERIRTREWKLGLETFAEALQAQPLFPEDWRPDGWAAVHARLGLASCHYSLGELRQARREYEEFMGIFTDPGPWHDLSETEKGWHRVLAARWPTVTGVRGVDVEKGQQ